MSTAKQHYPKIIWALLIAGAYVFGSSFYQGYMNGQGISHVGFPIDIQDKYLMAYYGLYAFLVKVVEPLGGILSSIARLNYLGMFKAVVLICILNVLIWLLIKLKQNKNKFQNFDIKGFFEKNAALKFAKLTLISGGIIYFFLFAILTVASITIYIASISYVPYQLGVQTAAREVKQFQEKGCTVLKRSKWNECVQIINGEGKVIYKGLLVAQHGTRIALIDEGAKSSRYYNLKSDDQIINYRVAN